MAELLDKLRERIIASGLSQNALARAAGVNPSQVNRVLSGERQTLTLESAAKLAAALGWELVFRPVAKDKRKQVQRGKHRA